MLHGKLEPTSTKGPANGFFAELSEKDDVDDAVFPLDGVTPLKDAVFVTASSSETRNVELGTASNVSLLRYNDEYDGSKTVLTTLMQKLLIGGYDHSRSNGSSLSEYSPSVPPTQIRDRVEQGALRHWSDGRESL